MNLIGVYNYTVVLTYLSLCMAVVGLGQATKGNMTAAVVCLVVAGICDAFDGKVARSKKDRTEDEKAFGIQLDSLCDVISFGVYPAMLCYFMGADSLLGSVCVFFYIFCAVTRLGFFNVLEAKRQQIESGANKEYRGLPVTTSAIIFPIVYACKFLLSSKMFSVLLHLYLLVVGFFFILDFKFKKPALKSARLTF